MQLAERGIAARATDDDSHDDTAVGSGGSGEHDGVVLSALRSKAGELGSGDGRGGTKAGASEGFLKTP